MSKSGAADADLAAHTADGVVGHIKALDGLRAVAILIVMISHGGLERIIPGGFGVTVFFFLSGYLITTLMRGEQNRTGKMSLRGFYVRRILRIQPPLWITIGVGVALGAAGVFWERIDAQTVIYQLTLLINYSPLWHETHGIPGMPLWSLAVEEHYYLLFPLFYVTVLRKLPGRTAALTCLALCAVVLAGRIAHVLAGTDLSELNDWSHTRIDSILFGSVLALWRNPAMDADGYRPGWVSLGLALLALLGTLVVRDEVFRQTLRYTIQGFALYVIFAFVLNDRGWILKALSSWPARTIGLLSYTLYLCHLTIMQMVAHYLPQLGALGGAVLSIALSFAYATAMYFAVERPLASWRRKLHANARLRATASAQPA